ncbi:MAG TPA: hypothetical protein VHT26_11295 [Trebonia sp.]|jgi:hypothetical protein|nr:hypothetical protein [Trebonia sp.]
MTNRAKPLAAAVTVLAVAGLAACSAAASSSRSVPASSAAAVKATASAAPAPAATVSGLAACQALANWEVNSTGSETVGDNTALQHKFAAVSDGKLSGDFAAWVSDVKTKSSAASADGAAVSGDCALLGVTIFPPVTPSAAPSSPAAPPPPQSSAPSLAGHTVATFSGSGIENTAKFTVTDTWKLDYSFDCSSFGTSGNFIVNEDGGSDFSGVTVNELGTGKSGSTYAYGDAGAHYLEINSECSWNVTVIDEG